MDQIACWPRVCASSQLAESPHWAPQGIVFAFHSQMLHTRCQHALPHISFLLLRRPCHSWIPLSQLALSSKPVFWNQSVLLMCHFSTPEFRLYIIICCLEYCAQNMADSLKPSVSSWSAFGGAESSALLQPGCIRTSGGGIEKCVLLPNTTNNFLKTFKFEKHCPRSTLLYRNHTGLDVVGAKLYA